MQVITNRPIVYSNASGVTSEAELYNKVKSECGDPPQGPFAFKKSKKFKSCRDSVIKNNPIQKKGETKKTVTPSGSDIKKVTDAAQKIKEVAAGGKLGEENKATESGSGTTQDTSKTKKMLLIGGGVLLVVIIAVVLIKRKNKGK